MGTFGERLRREREMRGIGLDEIATATKISTRMLRALEDERFDILPGGIFNKGFVRAYAKFLGIDEEQLVSEYSSAAGDNEIAREKEKFQMPQIKSSDRVSIKEDDRDQEISLEPKSQWGTIAVIVIIAVAIFAGYSVYQKKRVEKQQREEEARQTELLRKEQEAKQAEAARQAALAAAAATPADPSQANPADPNAVQNPGGTTGAPSPNGPATNAALPVPGTVKASEKTPSDAKTPTPDTKPKPTDSAAAKPLGIDLHIKVNHKSWVSISADGKAIVSGNLDAAVERSIHAKDKIVLTVGNAGAVEVSYNGKPIPSLGGPNQVRTLTFTTDGYQ